MQPKPFAMGYLYAALEVRPIVCGLPPWYDPLEDKIQQRFGNLHKTLFNNQAIKLNNV